MSSLDDIVTIVEFHRQRWKPPASLTIPLTKSLRVEGLKPATGRPYVPAFSLSGTVPAFTCDCLRFVCVFTWRRNSTCVCLRLREQCLRSKITSVSRVAHVLLLRFVPGNTGVNTLAYKRSQLIGNTAIVRKRCVIHKKSTCVCLRLSVAAFTRKRRDARFDLWPASGDVATLRHYVHRERACFTGSV